MRLACVVLLALATPARADEGALHGRIVDAVTRAPIAGATITADDGAVTESQDDGAFTLATSTTNLAVYADGYAPRLLDASDGEVIALTHDADDVEVIEVSGRAPDDASPTGYTLGRDQIRALPGGGNDALRAIQSVPGVSRVSYGLGGIVLRGATPTHNGVYVDDIVVPLAFHLGGVATIIPSTLIEEVEVTPGGADVAYGGRDGGNVAIEIRSPRTDRWRAAADVGMLDSAVMIEGPMGGGGLAIAARGSYADRYLPELLPKDTQIIPRYWDGQLRWERGPVTATVFFSDDLAQAEEEEEHEKSTIRMTFLRVGAQLQRRRGTTTWTVLPWLGWERFAFRFEGVGYEPIGDVTHDLTAGLRASAVRDTPWGDVAAGLDTQTHYRAADIDNPAVYDTDVGAWAEARWRVDGGKLTVKPGLRVDRFATGGWTIDPRAVITHELAPWLTLREELGIYHEPASSFGGTRTPAPERARQLSIGARVQLPGDVLASITGYHVERTAPPYPSAEVALDVGFNTGLGIIYDNLVANQTGTEDYGRRRASGLEISAQRRTTHWLLWLAYTRSSSEQTAGRYDVRGFYPDWVDQPNNLNAVASLSVRGWRFGARLRWASGLPYTPLLAGPGEHDGLGENVWAPNNSERLADFFSVDLRLDRAWTRRWGQLSFYVDLQNLTNQDNPEGVHWYKTKRYVTNGLPLLPTVGISYQPNG